MKMPTWDISNIGSETMLHASSSTLLLEVKLSICKHHRLNRVSVRARPRILGTTTCLYGVMRRLEGNS